MASAWFVARGQWMKLFAEFRTPIDLPWTMGYVIRKRMQIDNINEMSKDKRPTEDMIWNGTPEELEKWIDDAYNIKETTRHDEIPFVIRDDEVEE
jgi:hypothetical protein